MSAGYSKQAVRTVQENDNYYPPLRNIIASEENGVVKLTGGRPNNIISGTSAKLEAIMTTQNSYTMNECTKNFVKVGLSMKVQNISELFLKIVFGVLLSIQKMTKNSKKVTC